MSVTVMSVYIYNIKTITLETKAIPNTKDKWMGDFNTEFENRNVKYFIREQKL